MAGKGTDDRLMLETKKWTARIMKELENMEPAGKRGEEILTNAKAYVNDSGHFIRRGDLVRGFEAIIWAWAWLEIGQKVGLLFKDYITLGKGLDK